MTDVHIRTTVAGYSHYDIASAYIASAHGEPLLRVSFTDTARPVVTYVLRNVVHWTEKGTDNEPR